jgi:putative ABC transport system permease protein
MISLFSISYFSARERTKEIGIRIVNGAIVPEIIYLFIKNFLTWVIIAFIIAVPITWYSILNWLENYIYKTNISIWIFLLSGTVTFFLTIITISWQYLNAALRNPVETLRYE